MMCVLQELVQRREATPENAVRTAAALLAPAPRNRVCYDVGGVDLLYHDSFK